MTSSIRQKINWDQCLIQCTVVDKIEKMVESTDEKIKALEASSVNKDERITNLEVTLTD